METLDTHKDVKFSATEKAARLEEMVQDLKIFSVGISHDLRTPLRAIIGFSRALLEDHSSTLDETGKAYLVRIHAAGLRMDQLIQDALILGETNNGNLKLCPVNILSLVHEVVEIHPELNHVHAEISFGPVIPPVLAHESALFQCVSNLLCNAAKFVPDGVKPQIKIYSTLVKERVRVSFQDNGIGIAAEHQARIFDLFQRLNHKSEGTGIGLAVVKRAVEKMGGRVGVESEIAKGSTFWMEFDSTSPCHLKTK
jgi:signal transduction histidine kinase